MKTKNIIILSLIIALSLIIVYLYNLNKKNKQELREAKITNKIKDSTIISYSNIISINKVKIDSLIEQKSKIKVKYITLYDTIEQMKHIELVGVLDTILEDSVKLTTIDSIDYTLLTEKNTKQVAMNYVQLLECSEELKTETYKYEFCNYTDSLRELIINRYDTIVMIKNDSINELKFDAKKIKKQRNISYVANLFQFLLLLIK